VSIAPPAALRVLVVDDSPVNRHVITDALVASGRVVVVGHAANGEQALRMVAELEPDAVTLDMQMPKMDGFTFLRILMSTRPTPVVVLSSSAHSDVVFRALELGAVDFVAKSSDLLDSSNDAWRRDLLGKLLPIQRTEFRLRRVASPPGPVPATHKPGPLPPRFAVVVAASTGGPSALLHVLSRLPSSFPGALVIAQHMAPNFTRTFAERLNRTSPLAVSEAQDGDVLYAGHAYLCPGGMCAELRRDGTSLKLSVMPPSPEDRYVPSANRLFSSAAAVLGARALGVVLTGMADDGLLGARALRAAGGAVYAESEESAVVYGMPSAVVSAGLASKVLDLTKLAEALALKRS